MLYSVSEDRNLSAKQGLKSIRIPNVTLHLSLNRSLIFSKILVSNMFQDVVQAVCNFKSICGYQRRMQRVGWPIYWSLSRLSWEVCTVVLLGIQLFWYMTLCCWVSGSWHFKESLCLHLQGVSSTGGGASAGCAAYCMHILPHLFYRLPLLDSMTC